MAIDTVKIQSPSVTVEVVEAVKSLSSSKNRICMRAECGEIENVFTTSNLKGSYDANISIKTSHYKLSRRNGSSIKEPCEPYLTVECSVHKARIGHNVSGGSSDIIECVEWLVKYISTAIGGIELPPAQKWTVRQIDTAEMFQLASFDAVECWFKGLRLGDYYRKRPIHRYGGHGIQIGGHTTCLKFYHKGVEFRKHDRKRLAKIKIPLTKLEQIQSLADKTLRVEVSIKSQKLDYDFGHRPQVAEITAEYLNHVYDKEIASFLREGTSGFSLVREPTEVKRRLLDQHGNKLGMNVFRTWTELALSGEEEVRKNRSQTCFYEHIRLLREAGCSWHGVVKQNNLVPSDFSPVRTDKRRYIS